ncbi:mitotic spindle assembly checkpoint protein MAD2A-like [Boleophthalmus pectinirostris]|uniref:mitotic spindle assembly checkpoint protein MAD2A-like n=1 Tax=Boleophthalmus pectinirostris TaxID=150288 RepID=UPI00242E48F4|nr:mitotic spindle assembly checkpoint protein MAD2A-like [Boleophthalmus pectinirostris]
MNKGDVTLGDFIPDALPVTAFRGRKAAHGAFDLLVYTDKDLVVPEKWEESGPQIISQSEEVRLRSFTTSIHKVNSMVAYKRSDSL